MADAGLQAPNIPAPSPPLVQPAWQAPQQSCTAHFTTQSTRTTNGIFKIGHIFNQNFQENQKKMQKSHLLRTNNWMNVHHFLEGVKVHRFCLTLVGETRLRYESLQPINVDWQGLQNFFQQQYSKIGNTREQPFHAWRSFHFGDNTETIEVYVTCIIQETTL